MARRSPKIYSQAARLQDMVRTFMARRAGVTIEELVEVYGIARRTVYRDFDALAEAGYPLYAVETGSKKIWRFHDRFTEVAPVTLSTSELIALYVTRTQIGYLEGTPLAEDMDRVFGKLEKTLSPKHRDQLALFAKKFYTVPDAPKSYDEHLDLLWDVMDGLIRQLRCRMRYRSPRKKSPKTRTIEPLTLLTHKQGLYLLAREVGADRVLTFAVDRIMSFEPTRETFEYPRGYSPEKQVEGAFGIVAGSEEVHVRIRFAAEVAHLIAERTFHPGQKINRHKDGSLTLEMNLTALGAELTGFILSYGAKAEVLEPAELREQIAAELKAAAGKYGSDVS